MRENILQILTNEVVTTEEAAVLMHRHSSDIRKMTRQGRIPSVLKGHVRLIDIQDIKKPYDRP